MRLAKLIRFAPYVLFAMIAEACGPQPIQSPDLSSTSPSAIPQATNTPNPAGLCANSLVPVKPGATWTYTDNSGSANAEQFTATISDIRPDGFTVALTSGSSPAIDQQWACKPEGLVASSLGSGQGFLGLSIAGLQANLSTSNPTGVTVPANVQPGASWQYGLNLAGTLSQGSLSANLNGSIASSMQAIGTESVTVPAGAFEAVKVQSTSTIKVNAGYQGLTLPVTSVVNSTLWFAPHVGWIKSAVAGELAGAGFNTTTELQSYNIP